MAQAGADLKILLVCPWVVKLTGLQESLRAAGVAPVVVRVDFEAALRAAVMHHRFDVAFYSDTPSLSLATAETVIRTHVPKLELIRVEALEQIGPALVKLVASRRS